MILNIRDYTAHYTETAEIYDIGDFKRFQKISTASVRDFIVVADPLVYVSVCVCPDQWRSHTHGQPGLGPDKICLGPCKNYHVVPGAVTALSLRVVILINRITAYAKSSEYSYL